MSSKSLSDNQLIARSAGLLRRLGGEDMNALVNLLFRDLTERVNHELAQLMKSLQSRGFTRVLYPPRSRGPRGEPESFQSLAVARDSFPTSETEIDHFEFRRKLVGLINKDSDDDKDAPEMRNPADVSWDYGYPRYTYPMPIVNVSLSVNSWDQLSERIRREKLPGNTPSLSVSVTTSLSSKRFNGMRQSFPFAKRGEAFNSDTIKQAFALALAALTPAILESFKEGMKPIDTTEAFFRQADPARAVYKQLSAVPDDESMITRMMEDVAKGLGMKFFASRSTSFVGPLEFNGYIAPLDSTPGASPPTGAICSIKASKLLPNNLNSTFDGQKYRLNPKYNFGDLQYVESIDDIVLGEAVEISITSFGPRYQIATWVANPGTRLIKAVLSQRQDILKKLAGYNKSSK